MQSVVGIFSSLASAEQAVEGLLGSGMTQQSIIFLSVEAPDRGGFEIRAVGSALSQSAMWLLIDGGRQRADDRRRDREAAACRRNRARDMGVGEIEVAEFYRAEVIGSMLRPSYLKEARLK